MKDFHGQVNLCSGHQNIERAHGAGLGVSSLDSAPHHCVHSDLCSVDLQIQEKERKVSTHFIIQKLHCPR